MFIANNFCVRKRKFSAFLEIRKTVSVNILVVEDDISVLSSIVRLIERWGHKTEKSETGRDTLEKVKKRIFDLVLLDISLPDIRAQDLIAELKELRPEIGIVTMTGSSTKELEREIRTLGIIYYMSKPVSEEELKEILDHISAKKNQT